MEKTYSDINGTQADPNIAELAADYVETYYKLTVVNINQKIADISAVASFSMVGAIIVSFIALLFSIAGSLGLGILLGSTALGFLAMGFVYLLLFVFFYTTRKKIFFPFIKNLVIKSIYE